MAFVLYQSVKLIESKGWMKKLVGSICSSNLSTESTVFLPHQSLDKSTLTESYSSVQRLVWCPHFAFCCSDTILTPFLSFQCCHLQQIGVGGTWTITVPGREKWGFQSVSLKKAADPASWLLLLEGFLVYSSPLFSPTQKVAQEKCLQ